MQREHRVFLVLVLFLALFPVATMAWRVGPAPTPTVMMDITPDIAMPGDLVTVTGLGLNPSIVRDVFLLEGRHAYYVDIVEQTSTLLRFRVPENMPSGRKRLAAAITGRAELVEQDVYLMILPWHDDRPTGTGGE